MVCGLRMFFKVNTVIEYISLYIAIYHYISISIRIKIVFYNSNVNIKNNYCILLQYDQTIFCFITYTTE